MNPLDYSFNSLLYGLGETDTGGCPSLCYLVSLVNSVDHKISETLPAKRILCWLYDFEEQALDGEDLKAEEEKFFKYYFVGGFHPQTPCMVVTRWSPISAMLENGMEPRVLNREPKFLAVATGIWDPRVISGEGNMEWATTDEALFWAILGEVARIALERKMWISVIAQPGWDYARAIESLPGWPEEEVAKAGRILWKRTKDG